MAARALSHRRRDPRRSPPGDRSLCRPSSSASPEPPRAHSPRQDSSHSSCQDPRRERRRRARDGHPGSRQEPHRRGIRRPPLRPAEPRRARRDVAGHRRRTRQGAVIRRADASFSTTPTSHVRRGATRSRLRAGTESRRGASGSTRRSRTRRSTSSSGCSSALAHSPLPGSFERGGDSSRACSRRPRR